MKKLFKDSYKLVKSNKHPILKLFGIVFLFLIIINGIYYFASAYSPGCLSCHYMKPYYDQSAHSVHSDVSCVTCHPGRRILTAPYLLRYIAGSYNPRPRAEVDDKICLDCHEKQDLKKNTAFAMNISFDHSDHLGDLKRGKNLRCTSCHARGEEKEHFTINKSVCFTCHFKGAERGHSVTSCNVCHGIPNKIVQHGEFQFNHEGYLKIGVDCSQCHLDVTKGNAEVDKKNCYKCHVERTDEFANIEKVHNTHITDHGVDCDECHNSIDHGKVKMISTLEANCENCHQMKHSPQREMYIGSEGRGVGSIPSRMFAAQVSCEGCHVDINKDGVSDMNERRQSCIKCHEQGYDKMLDNWVVEMKKAVDMAAPGIETARQMIAAAEKQGRNVDAEKNYFMDAEANFKLVKNGRGVHNLEYAIKLLENISNNIDGIVSRLGNKNFKTSRSRLITDDGAYCGLCHSNVNVSKFGESGFPHSSHTKFTDCSKCHSRKEHKKLVIDQSGCESCHKGFSKAPENVKIGGINFPHSLHSKKKNIDCVKCHTNSQDFSKVQNTCTSCHHKDKVLRKDCANCHPTQNNTYNGSFMGRSHDPDIMKTGGVGCEDCHLPNKMSVSRPDEKVCVNCHDASYRTMQNEWTSEITSKSKELAGLISQAASLEQTDKTKEIIHNSKQLIAAIRADKSKGIHNYVTFSSLLDRYIKDIKQLLPK